MDAKIGLPLPEQQVFRYGAADEILDVVSSDPNAVFTNRELRRITGYGGPSVQNALDLLVALELVVADESGNRTEYRVNGDRILGPIEGVAAVPQAEFHAPIRELRTRVLETVDDVEGLLVFGSVARGEADRQSDVDVFVAVGSDPPLDARRAVSDVVAAIEQESFDGHRYSFDHHVESTSDAADYGDRLVEIATEGIPLYQTEEFEALRQRIVRDAADGSGGDADE